MLRRTAAAVCPRRMGVAAGAFRTVHTPRAAMSTTYYSADHEWVEVDNDVATIGITDFAQKELGDVVYVGLPEVGDSFDREDGFAAVESVKAASDVYAPLTGSITAVNNDLVEDPALVNQDPEGKAWFVKMTVEDPSELDDLMTREQYDESCE